VSPDPIKSATPWMLALLVACVGIGVGVTLFILGRQAEAVGAGAVTVAAAAKTVRKTKRSAKQRDKEERAEVVDLQERLDSSSANADLEAMQEKLRARREGGDDGAA